MTRTPAQQAATRAAWAARRAVIDARIEDMEFLIQTGSTHEDAARRAGWTSMRTAERVLYRRGRHDLARPLGAAAWREQRYGT